MSAIIYALLFIFLVLNNILYSPFSECTRICRKYTFEDEFNANFDYLLKGMHHLSDEYESLKRNIRRDKNI